MRLDKYLAEVGLGTRKEVKNLLKKGNIALNGEVVKDGKIQVNEQNDTISYHGEQLSYQKFYYYLLNKPKGVVSATKDNLNKTVVELLSKDDFREDIFPVGRLDKDTEGLLLLSNDGQLAHDLLSPKKHVEKEYYAKIIGIPTKETIEQFKNGLTLKNGEKTKPSELFIESVKEGESMVRLIIHEGKFHQVKRMFKTLGMKVSYLKRLRMGTLKLDESLKQGEYRPLTEDEIKSLKTRV